MEYRKEIDGLRAFAVVPVILFHAGYAGFSGGFVGVDIFFVISGYLITSIIASELDSNKFSIVTFYERRSRRILPALFLVMLVSLFPAWLWLPAPEMTDFFESLVAVSLFSSNILFWKESGYFDTASELKPLLHTWSLAVEEQFYIFFPLVLVFIWRFSKIKIIFILCSFALASLLLSQWGTNIMPSATFYLLPTRGWELLVGAFAAFYLRKKIIANSVVAEPLSVFGFLLILVPIFLFDRLTPFPGFFAVIPAFGTFLIIVYSGGNNLVGRFLGLDIFVKIGLISYSAYLWHQPLIAFMKRANFFGVNFFSLPASILAITFLLAFLSWKYVERPFRDRKVFGRKLIFKISGVGLSFFIALGVFGVSNDGFRASQAKVMEVPHPVVLGMLSDNFYVIGDSHAKHLISGLRQITSGDVVDYSSSGCIPFRDVDRFDKRFAPGSCVKKINNFLNQLIERDPGGFVLLGSMGPVYLDGTTFRGKDPDRVDGLGVRYIKDPGLTDHWKIYEIGLRDTLSELVQLKKTKTIFLIDIPEIGVDYGCAVVDKEFDFFGINFSDFVSRSDVNSCFVSRSEYDARSRRYKNLVLKVSRDFPGVSFFDPTDLFCDQNYCRGYDKQYGLLYKDADHLSAAGSLFYAINLRNILSSPK